MDYGDSEKECHTCRVKYLESIVQCAQKNCQKWFCNNKDSITFQSHIIHHLTKEKHLTIAFHSTHPLYKINIQCLIFFYIPIAKVVINI